MAVIRPVQPADELIPLIYQGPLEAAPWQSFLRCLRVRMQCEVAGMALRVRRADSPPILIYSREDGVGEREINEAYKNISRHGHADPIGDVLAHSDQVHSIDELITTADLLQTEYYKYMMKPYGLIHQMGMRIAEPSGWKSKVGLMAGPKREKFGQQEKSVFVELRPHLERALELFARIKRSESEKQIFEETLDRLSIGAFILDGNAKIIDVNQAGRSLAESEDGPRIFGEKLALSRTRDNDRLVAAIKAALIRREHGDADCFVDALRIERKTGGDLALLVRAVTTWDPYQSDICPSVIVYVTDCASQAVAPERFLAQLFGLSASEAALAALLANGLTLTQAAERLNITESTVRSYSKRMFGKTGVSRQADLVRLILTSVAPLARTAPAKGG